METFLDLRNYDASRDELRRLEKQLKKSPQFSRKVGRVLFFRFGNEIDKMTFYASITRALSMTGYSWIITEEYEHKLMEK